jgi:hypothetical protein
MAAVVRPLYRNRIGFVEDATPALCGLMFEPNEVAIAAELVRVTSSQRRGIVIELKPRTFTETAGHFGTVTRKINWPLDEPDVD